MIDRVAHDDSASARILEMLSQSSVTSDPASRLFVEQAIDLLCTQLIRAHSSIGTMLLQAPEHAARAGVRGLAGQARHRIHARVHGLARSAWRNWPALVGLSQFHFCNGVPSPRGRNVASPASDGAAHGAGASTSFWPSSDLSIIQVALAVGYQTPSAFAASFRKATQVTPSEFRRTL